jgi:ATP-dependent helicase/nuclease subunit B
MAESIEAWGIGGSGDGGKAAVLSSDKAPAIDAGEAAWAGLARLLEAFLDPAMPYLAAPRPALAPRYNDFQHLARIDPDGAGDE